RRRRSCRPARAAASRWPARGRVACAPPGSSGPSCRSSRRPPGEVGSPIRTRRRDLSLTGVVPPFLSRIQILERPHLVGVHPPVLLLQRSLKVERTGGGVSSQERVDVVLDVVAIVPLLLG